MVRSDTGDGKGRPRRKEQSRLSPQQVEEEERNFYHLSHQEAIHTHTHMFFFRIFSIIGYYKILTTVPRVIQKVLAVYLLYI